jgi:hypothetical protein
MHPESHRSVIPQFPNTRPYLLSWADPRRGKPKILPTRDSLQNPLFLFTYCEGVAKPVMLIREERKRRLGAGFLMLVISGILGNVVGIFMGALLPDGILNDLLAKSLVFGLDPPFHVDMWIVSFSLGFHLKLNMCSFLFMFFGLILYKKI